MGVTAGNLLEYQSNPLGGWVAAAPTPASLADVAAALAALTGEPHPARHDGRVVTCIAAVTARALCHDPGLRGPVRPGIGTVPRNVALICQWTWACTAPPRGPDQHANQAGYEIIAQTFQRAAGQS